VTPLTYALIMLVGGISVQDGIASICWYRKSENWKNHAWRLPRIVIGIWLVILSGIQLGGMG